MSQRSTKPTERVLPRKVNIQGIDHAIVYFDPSKTTFADATASIADKDTLVLANTLTANSQIASLFDYVNGIVRRNIIAGSITGVREPSIESLARYSNAVLETLAAAGMLKGASASEARRTLQGRSTPPRAAKPQLATA